MNNAPMNNAPMNKEQTIGDAVLQRFDRATVSLEQLVSTLNNKISSIQMFDDPPTGTECCVKDETYPPYFSDLRVMCNRIEAMNNELSATINRIKL